MRIRRFRPEDAAEVARMHRRSIRRINAKDYPSEQVRAWSGRTSAKRMRDSIKLGITRFVAIEDMKIIGFADFNGEELTGLYIHPDYVGQGVGTALLKRLEEEAKKRGITKFSVTSTITAKAFYQKQGYKVLGESIHEVDEHKLRVFKLEKKLGP